MGSTWTTSKNSKLEGFLGKEVQIPFYLQFVPGYVVDVTTSPSSLSYNAKPRNVNSILALPHLTEKPFNRSGTINESNRYFPLLRGWADVPAKGDPVLLCTIGKVQYYLGPLNSQNNPNFNPDTLKRSEPTINTTNKKVLYNAYRHLLPQQSRFAKYIKGRVGKINNELVEIVSRYFEIGKKESKEHIKMLTLEELSSIVGLYGYTNKQIKKIVNG